MKILILIYLLTAIGLTPGGRSTDATYLAQCRPVAYPGIFFFGGRGGSTNSVEDREKGDLGMVAS